MAVFLVEDGRDVERIRKLVQQYCGIQERKSENGSISIIN